MDYLHYSSPKHYIFKSIKNFEKQKGNSTSIHPSSDMSLKYAPNLFKYMKFTNNLYIIRLMNKKPQQTKNSTSLTCSHIF